MIPNEDPELPDFDKAIAFGCGIGFAMIVIGIGFAIYCAYYYFN